MPAPADLRGDVWPCSLCSPGVFSCQLINRSTIKLNTERIAFSSGSRITKGAGDMWQADQSHLDPGGVNGSLKDAGVHQIRQRLHRDATFGSAAWTTVTTSMLGLEASLRPMKRPRKLAETQNTPVLPSTV